ncbi:hypothetical protein UT300005_02630 [Clostridium sp. CTA-5]
MKISEKFLKCCNFLICLFPIIYYIVSDTFHANKYIKFLIFILMCLYTILLGIGYRFKNKLIIKKKDLIELMLWILFIVILMICWYFRFVY